MSTVEELTVLLRSEAKALSSSFSDGVFGPLYRAADLLESQAKTIAAQLDDLNELNKRNHWLLAEASRLEASLTEQMSAYAACASKRDALIDEVDALKADLASYMRIAESETNYRVKLEDALVRAIEIARNNKCTDCALNDYIADWLAHVVEVEVSRSSEACPLVAVPSALSRDEKRKLILDKADHFIKPDKS